MQMAEKFLLDHVLEIKAVIVQHPINGIKTLPEGFTLHTWLACF